jgi:chaperonin cofactor prefoldin
MLLPSAALSFARVHITRATIGKRNSLPLLFTPSKCISLGERRRFAEMFARKNGTKTLVDAPSGGYVRPPIDPNVVIGACTLVVGFFGFYFALFGFYFAIKSDSDSKINGVESKINGVEDKINGVENKINGVESKINGVKNDILKMLESKLDAQDRKLDGQDDTIAALDQKIVNFAEKFDLQQLKYILSKKSWGWFGLNASPVKNENEHIIDALSMVADNLNTKFKVIHNATENLNTKFKVIHNATENLGTEIETMRKDLNSMHSKPNAKDKDGIISGSTK